MDITVFGTPVCPNCSNVKSYLESQSVSYSYKTIGEDVDKDEVDSLIGRVVRSVPVIVIDGTESDFNELKMKVQAVQAIAALDELSL